MHPTAAAACLAGVAPRDVLQPRPKRCLVHVFFPAARLAVQRILKLADVHRQLAAILTTPSVTKY